MNVVWHDHKFAQFDICKMCGYGTPHLFHYLSHLIQHHFSINDLPKHHSTILGDDGHKIGTRLRIIKFRQMKISPVGYCRIGIHGIILPLCVTPTLKSRSARKKKRKVICLTHTRMMSGSTLAASLRGQERNLTCARMIDLCLLTSNPGECTI